MKMTKFQMMVAMVLALGLLAGCTDDTACTDCSCNPALCDGGGDADVGGDADADSDTDTATDDSESSEDSSCSSDDPAPVVAFVQPTDGAEVTGAQTVEVSVADRCGIREVTLAVDGATSATWTDLPYTLAWDTSGLVSGNHTLRASATDMADQTVSATIEVDVRAECLTPTDCPPRVRIVYPTAGSHVCGTLNVEATATGEDDVTQVEFLADDVLLGTDNTAPYQAEWVTTSLADGNHTLTATARDASGQEAWHTVSVAVENTGGACDNLPTAVIAEPADGSYVHGDVTVRVNASDDIGVIRVRVFMDAGMIWEDTTAPFEGIWHTGDFTEGPHLLRAEATDTADQPSAEASVEVDIDRTPPTVAITSPYGGEIVSGTRTVTASATDNLSVASVTFTATGSLTRSFTDTEAPFEWSLDFPRSTHCGDIVTIEAEAADHASWTATDIIAVTLAGPSETCDGLDNDCDGATDEDFDCQLGTSTTCTTSCSTTGTRHCSSTCTWPTACNPPDETCNGLDDDCDSVCDNGFACCAGTPGCMASCTSACPAELGGVCNVVYQCGCGAGQRCIIGTSMREECVAVGTDPIGTSCDSTDNCVPQAQCLGPTGGITCMQYCYSTVDCPMGFDCIVPLSGVSYMLCSLPPVDCDPFTGAGCPIGDACLFLPPMASMCAPAGSGTPGEFCDAVPCQVGSACISFDGGSTNRCHKYCSIGGGIPNCSDVPGTSCQNIGDPTVGLCIS